MESSEMQQRPVAEIVRRNVRALRERQGMTGQQLTERMAALGGRINQTGISKIEKGQRRVDVDDLVILAAALNTSPLCLLLPQERSDALPAQLAPALTTTTERAWSWALGEVYLTDSGQPSSVESPPWIQNPPSYDEAVTQWQSIAVEHEEAAESARTGLAAVPADDPAALLSAEQRVATEEGLHAEAEIRVHELMAREFSKQDPAFAFQLVEKLADLRRAKDDAVRRITAAERKLRALKRKE